MKAVILAAGRGSRLYPYTKYIPKCLLDIGGITILENQINHIRYCGIDEVVIVVGFGFDKVENFLKSYDGVGMKIKTLYNPFYQTTNSLISLWIARAEMDDDIVVMNGDDVFEPDVLDIALSFSDEKILLPVKRKSHYEEEDMKVEIRGGKVIDISKRLTMTSAESVGIRVFRDRGVELLRRAIEEEMRTEGAENKWYVSAIRRLIRKGYRVKSIDINDLFWMDVDFPGDLFRARYHSNRFIQKPSDNGHLRLVEPSR
ncbi:MAG: phosphocholine cytidylyltransferase family protein [Candidatus Methanosuratincola sp.]|jgi:choline kinase